jgi:hypothetical protein
MNERYINSFLKYINNRRGLVFGLILIIALLSFELFNFSTTDFAFTDFLGDLDFLGLRWATILAIAFCTIDFAGIARLFTPESGERVKSEAWYLLVAWFLAGTMNAILTWWGVSVAILNHSSLGNEVIERGMLLRIVPIFIAVMVWIIRVLIIGTFSQAGGRLFSQAEVWVGRDNQLARIQTRPQVNPTSGNYRNLTPASFGSKTRFTPMPKPNQIAPTPRATMQAGTLNNNQAKIF